MFVSPTIVYQDKCGRVGPHETEVDKHVQKGVFNW